MKKRNLRFKSIKFLSLILAGLLLAACSANDELTGYDNDEERVEAMKAKVMKLADEYGLDVTICNDNDFAQKVLNGTFCLDSVENEFRKVSQLLGYYPYITAKDNKLKFDTYTNKLLNEKKTIRNIRDVQSGSFSDLVSFMHKEEKKKDDKEKPLTIYFSLNWSYSLEGTDSRFVKIENVSTNETLHTVNHPEYATCQFVGTQPSFTYGFSVTLSYSTYECSITLYITGTYNNGFSSATISNKPNFG